MLKNFLSNLTISKIRKIIIIGVIIGGLLATVSTLGEKANILTFLGCSSILEANPINTSINRTFLVIILGAGIGTLIILFQKKDSKEKIYTSNNKTLKDIIDDTNNMRLRIREEQLDISKQLVQTGEVAIHKENVIEKKNIVVPITREELVIEKKVPGADDDIADATSETIRIPISEERVEVIKHPVTLEEVDIYQHQFQENKCINEVLKKEKVSIESSGNPKITDEES